MVIGAVWEMWSELSSLLTNIGVPLRSRGRVYNECMHQAVHVIWSRILSVNGHIDSCDGRRLRYIAGVTWKDRIRSEEGSRRCRMEMLRRRKLRWYSHVKRRDEDERLGRILNIFMNGGRPTGRPKKSWRKTIEENMTQIQAREEDALDRRTWKRLKYSQSSYLQGKGDVKYRK